MPELRSSTELKDTISYIILFLKRTKFKNSTLDCNWYVARLNHVVQRVPSWAAKEWNILLQESTSMLNKDLLL